MLTPLVRFFQGCEKLRGETEIFQKNVGDFWGRSGVSCRAEADWQIDLAEGLDALPRRNAMKWRLAGAKLVQSDPHELQGVGGHDVEAAV